jgi:hypothetical protein
MTVRPRPPDTGTRPDGEASTGLPRWLYLAGIVVAILILVFVVFHLTGGGLGNHGPGRHAPPDDADSHTPPSGAKKDHSPPGGFHRHVPPEGAHK